MASGRAYSAAFARTLLVALAMSSAADVGAQPRTVVVHGQRQWTVGGWWRQAHGLPQDRVTVIKQTRDGYLWLGTRNGVGRYDGKLFTTWSAGRPGVPPEGEVYSLAERADGGLWLTVYGGGLVRYDRGRFTTIGTAEGLSDNYARAVAEAADGAVWVGTDRGLNRLVGTSVSHFHAGEGPASDSIRSVLVEADGSVYAGAERGLFRVSGSALVRVPLPGGANDAAVEAVLRDRRGRLWVATSNGLVCIDGGLGRIVGAADGVSATAVRNVYEDSGGRIWVATIAGVDCAEPGPVLRFTPVVTGGDAATLLEDREGSIWVGFRGQGVIRLQHSLFAVYDAARGLPSDSTSTVYEARDGVVWIGAGNGLAALHSGTTTTFGAGDGLPNRPVSSITEDDAGRIWVGTEAGLFRSLAPARCAPPRCAVRFAAVGGHASLREHIRVLRQQGTAMLVGTNSSGVKAIPLAGTAPITSVVDGEVRAMVLESPDRLWIGTRDLGLFLVAAGGVTHYTTVEGLPHITVQSLHRGADGTLWIGTRRGLAWRRDGRIHSVTTAQGLHQNHVYGITSDPTGRLWLTSGNGVSTVTPQELYDVAAGQRPALAPSVLGTEHGLPTTLCALSHDPVIMTDRRGLVWVATLGGVVSLEPGTLPADPAPPRVLVETVTLETTAIDPGAVAEVLHERGTVAFTFTAPTFVAPDRVRYRYRLLGFDPAWVSRGASNDARFTNIPPGRYVFEVSAALGQQAWGPGVALDVHLRPRLYQRSWFVLTMTLVAIGAALVLALALHQVRVRHLRAREQELARRVDDALAQLKVLRGFLPTCAWCKRVRDENGEWTQMELYVRAHSEAEFSHGLCPDCMTRNFPDDSAILGNPPAEGPAARPRA